MGGINLTEMGLGGDDSSRKRNAERDERKERVATTTIWANDLVRFAHPRARGDGELALAPRVVVPTRHRGDVREWRTPHPRRLHRGASRGVGDGGVDAPLRHRLRLEGDGRGFRILARLQGGVDGEWATRLGNRQGGQGAYPRRAVPSRRRPYVTPRQTRA